MPFVDGKCYPKICFTCYHVPKTVEQIYNEDGTVKEDKELLFSHRNLHTIKEMIEYQMAETPQQARDSVRAVKASISEADMLDLRATKKRPKDPETEIDSD